MKMKCRWRLDMSGIYLDLGIVIHAGCILDMRERLEKPTIPNQQLFIVVMPSLIPLLLFCTHLQKRIKIHLQKRIKIKRLRIPLDIQVKINVRVFLVQQVLEGHSEVARIVLVKVPIFANYPSSQHRCRS